jgi:hypothetical protein
MTIFRRPGASRTAGRCRVWGLVALALLAGCVDDKPFENDLFAFEVRLAAGTEDQFLGTEAQPLAFAGGASCTTDADCPNALQCVPNTTGQRLCALTLRFDIQALGRDGLPFPYRGPIHVRSTPGELTGTGQYLVMDNGRLENVSVKVIRAIGPTHIWFEADGVLPRPATADYGQCSDGIDNDRNGLLDLADPGCADANDDLEAPVNLSTGVSPTLWFSNPRIRDIQFTDSLRTSPLVGQQVQVSAGNLVVTNVISNGFYVVDLDENAADRLFNGLFVFTFSKPQDIYFGDKLCGFSGAVQEHVGQTQLVFPSFQPYYPGNPACSEFPGLNPLAKVPASWDVSPILAAEIPNSPTYSAAVYQNSRFLERFESNLVTFTDVAVSTRFIACDRNLNGRIDAGDETLCRNDCQTAPLCSDLEGYFQYAQYAGITAGKKKIYGSLGLADEFKPLDIRSIGGPDESGRCAYAKTDKGFDEYTCPPVTLAGLTGSLRHIYLCGDTSDEEKCSLQFWVIDPRFDGDVVVAPTP